jgi:hypothetical protein
MLFFQHLRDSLGRFATKLLNTHSLLFAIYSQIAIYSSEIFIPRNTLKIEANTEAFPKMFLHRPSLLEQTILLRKFNEG